MTQFCRLTGVKVGQGKVAYQANESTGEQALLDNL